VEFFLLVAALAIVSVMTIPWVLSYTRRAQSGGRWPSKVVTVYSAAKAGEGAYREGDVEVERVVSVEQGPPAEVARAARAAFSAASMMFVGGVLVGAWVPVSLLFGAASGAASELAYGAGVMVALPWLYAAWTQFDAAWDRWEPEFEAALAQSEAACRRAALAASLSVLTVLATRALFGLAATTLPVWFSLFAMSRALFSLRSLKRLSSVYAAAAANERARVERAQRDDERREARTGVRVSVEATSAQGAGEGARGAKPEAVIFERTFAAHRGAR
jgi:hypothetical protein